MKDKLKEKIDQQLLLTEQIIYTDKDFIDLLISTGVDVELAIKTLIFIKRIPEANLDPDILLTMIKDFYQQEYYRRTGITLDKIIEFIESNEEYKIIYSFVKQVFYSYKNELYKANYQSKISTIELDKRVKHIEKREIILRFRRHAFQKILINNFENIFKQDKVLKQWNDMLNEIKFIKSLAHDKIIPQKLTLATENSNLQVYIPDSFISTFDSTIKKFKKTILKKFEKFMKDIQYPQLVILLDTFLCSSLDIYLNISAYNYYNFEGILNDLQTQSNSKESKIMVLKELFEYSHKVPNYEEWIKSRKYGLEGDRSLKTNIYPKPYKKDTVRAISNIIGLK